MNKKLTIEVVDNKWVVNGIMSDMGRVYAVLNPKDIDVIDIVTTYLYQLLEERKTAK